MEPKARWQHVLLFVAASLLLSTAIIFSIHLSGHASPKATPKSIGAMFLAAALILGGFAIWSIRQAARREESTRLLAAGLFELPPKPSEALIRLNARLARHFGLSRTDVAPALPSDEQTLSYESREKIIPRPPWPATFDELCDAIYDAIERAAREKRPDGRKAIADVMGWPPDSFRFIDTTHIPLGRFLAARQALADALSRPPDSIRWSDRVAAVIPPGRRRFNAWQRLRAQATNLPPLDLDPWVENIAILTFLAALITLVVPVARWDAIRTENPSLFQSLVGRVFGLTLSAILIGMLMIPVYFLGRRYASRIPPAIDTIATLACYFHGPAADPRTWTPADVESHLRDLIADAKVQRTRLFDVQHA